MKSLTIRNATPDDLTAIRQLFYDTVTTVNTRDYNPQQIAAWADGWKNAEKWEAKVREQYFLVAVSAGQIVGIGSLENTGYLDVMYVHKGFQGQGIASRLLNVIEVIARRLALAEIYADVSLTAKPFFERREFRVNMQYTREVRGATFLNTVMTKTLV